MKALLITRKLLTKVTKEFSLTLGVTTCVTLVYSALRALVGAFDKL